MRKEIFCAFIRLKIKAIQKFNWCTFTWFYDEKENDHEGTRTLNLPIRSRTPCPLGHAARQMRKEIFCAFIRGKIKAIKKKTYDDKKVRCAAWLVKMFLSLTVIFKFGSRSSVYREPCMFTLDKEKEKIKSNIKIFQKLYLIISTFLSKLAVRF